MVLVLLTGCMTDPAGNTCAWQPGSDGYCSSDDGGSSAPKKLFTAYYSPAAAVAPDLLVAMTRSKTDEPPQIELAAVRPGELPVPVPVTISGEPLVGTSAPQLAAIGTSAYLTWVDANTRGSVGALVDADGTIVSARAHLGLRTGFLSTVAERFVFVHPPDAAGVVKASWIGLDGRFERSFIDVATDVEGSGLIDVAGGESIVAIATRHVDHTLAITRAGDDGTVFTVSEVVVDGKVTKGHIVVRADGGVLGVFEVQPAKGKPTRWTVIVDEIGATRVTPSTLPPLLALVRGPRSVLATTDETTSRGYMLDDDGIAVPSWDIVVPRSNEAIATSNGFAVLHTQQSGVKLTPIEDGVAQPAIMVADGGVEEAGCGCRSSGGGASAMFAGVLQLVVRRRRKSSGERVRAATRTPGVSAREPRCGDQC